MTYSSHPFKHAAHHASRILLALILVAPLSCGPAGTNEPALRPNILLIVTDDQRFDMMGNVSPWLVTPNMDALAERGVRFDQAFVTTSICAASRATILTGLVERTHRFTFGTPPLARSLTDSSYAALLRAAGYTTGFVGKFGVKVEDGATDTMFDRFIPLSPPYEKLQADGSIRHLTDIEADSAVSFLRNRDRDRPFMLSVSLNAPHAEDDNVRQYIWPAAMDSLYLDTPVPEPILTDEAFTSNRPAFLRDPEVNLNRYRWHWRFDEPEKAVRMTRGYWRMISGVDAAIGRLLDELERQGVDDQTVVMLIGDNGYFVGKRGYAGKWLPYDPSIHVPLIVMDPRGRPEGRQSKATVLNIDVAPTVLDLARVAAPRFVQGRSLVPLLGGEVPADWRSEFFIEHLMENPQIVKHEGVRSGKWRYSRYFEVGYEELFDLEADPVEAINLAGDPRYGALLDSLRERTDALKATYERAR